MDLTTATAPNRRLTAPVQPDDSQAEEVLLALARLMARDIARRWLDGTLGVDEVVQ
jgi:hypothetical protein